MNSIEQEFIIKLAQNYPELAKAQSSERTSASADKLTACHSSAGVSDPNKITTLSPLIIIKLNGWQRMKDMMMRIAKIRELVKQRDIDEIASLVDKYVLNTVF